MKRKLIIIIHIFRFINSTFSHFNRLYSLGMASEGSGKNNNSTLRIIDLAGSERASKTTFEGGDFFQRRQEAININKTVRTYCMLDSHM